MQNYLLFKDTRILHLELSFLNQVVTILERSVIEEYFQRSFGHRRLPGCKG